MIFEGKRTGENLPRDEPELTSRETREEEDDRLNEEDDEDEMKRQEEKDDEEGIRSDDMRANST